MNAPDFREAERFLAALDPDWAALVATVGPCLHAPKPLREPWQALLRAVAYQQLSVRAGDTMIARFLALYGDVAFPSPQQVCDTPVEALRACGFSGRKADTLRAIAAAALDGTVPSLAEALTLGDDALVARLTPLHGIGRWTVDMMLIYTLGRTDLLPADDLGVRDGYRRLRRLDRPPTPRQMSALALPWSPHRTAASWYLWRVPRTV
ncbi:DNA-3-methyladenine glycosylase 1 [Methyloversatilis universalis FAM5]|uniref:DNA-3-methyladenine glycosylase II n=1 Tax=Methyloversatilis universalis (strain ATCC BAA-1314 / DSM 25237 / JCM 13912 / CCUG 52030 / FAM5) TaxID=1000565 RepID=F5RD53_METUF|nr:DNA-3-methyladenine glycosylase [Methyloversatilis universalis]EGK71524.1 DNA-3-methyladenine glycosylase 1 [Methyloversatilis universalis FAM5]